MIYFFWQQPSQYWRYLVYLNKHRWTNGIKILTHCYSLCETKAARPGSGVLSGLGGRCSRWWYPTPTTDEGAARNGDTHRGGRTEEPHEGECMCIQHHRGVLERGTLLSSSAYYHGSNMERQTRSDRGMSQSTQRTLRPRRTAPSTQWIFQESPLRGARSSNQER